MGVPIYIPTNSRREFHKQTLKSFISYPRQTTTPQIPKKVINLAQAGPVLSVFWSQFPSSSPKHATDFYETESQFFVFFFLFIILLIVYEYSSSCVSRISEKASSSQKVLQMLENSCYSLRFFDLLAYWDFPPEVLFSLSPLFHIMSLKLVCCPCFFFPSSLSSILDLYDIIQD